MRIRNRVLWWLLGGVAALPLGGCALGLDLLDPGLPIELGLDPDSFKTQQGVVIVVFNNTTQFPVTFQAFEGVEVGAGDSVSEARNFSIDVNAGEDLNQVLDCPVEVISPGTLAADSTLTNRGTVAATVFTATNVLQIQYVSEPLRSGLAYSCGDVIEFRLVQAGAGENEQQYGLVIRVLPGQ